MGTTTSGYNSLSDDRKVLAGRYCHESAPEILVSINILNLDFAIKIGRDTIKIIINPQFFKLKWLLYSPYNPDRYPYGFDFNQQVFYFHRYRPCYIYPELYSYPIELEKPDNNCIISSLTTDNEINITGSIVVDNKTFDFTVKIKLDETVGAFIVRSMRPDNIWNLHNQDFTLIFRSDEGKGFLFSPHFENNDDWGSQTFSFKLQ